MAGAVRADRADVLRDLGRYDEARQEYEAALAVVRETERLHAQGRSVPRPTGHAGPAARGAGRGARDLPPGAGDLPRPGRAADRSGDLAPVGEWWPRRKRIGRRRSAATARAVQHREQLGDSATMRRAQTCNQLAIVAEDAGRPAEAERWYLRAQEIKDRVSPHDGKHTEQPGRPLPVAGAAGRGGSAGAAGGGDQGGAARPLHRDLEHLRHPGRDRRGAGAGGGGGGLAAQGAGPLRGVGGVGATPIRSWQPVIAAIAALLSRGRRRALGRPGGIYWIAWNRRMTGASDPGAAAGHRRASATWRPARGAGLHRLCHRARVAGAQLAGASPNAPPADTAIAEPPVGAAPGGRPEPGPPPPQGGQTLSPQAILSLLASADPAQLPAELRPWPRPLRDLAAGEQPDLSALPPEAAAQLRRCSQGAAGEGDEAPAAGEAEDEPPPVADAEGSAAPDDPVARVLADWAPVIDDMAAACGADEAEAGAARERLEPLLQQIGAEGRMARPDRRTAPHPGRGARRGGPGVGPRRDGPPDRGCRAGAAGGGAGRGGRAHHGAHHAG